MQQHLAELLALAVSKCYGDLHGSIFAYLALAGRSTLNKLIQNCEGTPIQARLAVVVMLKHQLILHSYDPKTGVAFYEPNLNYAYNVTIRTGSLISLVEERHGERAAEVFEGVLHSGVVRVVDLENLIKKQYEEEGAKHDSPRSERSIDFDDSGISGVSAIPNDADASKSTKSDLPTALGDLRANLLLLLKSGLIEHIGENQFLPPYDFENEVVMQVMEHNFPGGIVSGAEAKVELQTLLDRKRRTLRDESHSYFTNIPPPSAAGVKRARSPDDEDIAQPTKRQKANNTLSNTTQGGQCNSWAAGQVLKNELVLRVNFEKCNVDLRNQQLVRLASRYIGETTSKVYEALLRVMEGKVSRCYDPYDRLSIIAMLDQVKRSKGKGGGGKKKAKGKKEKDSEDVREEAEIKAAIAKEKAETEKAREAALRYRPDPDENAPFIKVEEVFQILDPNLNLNIGLAGNRLWNDAETQVEGAASSGDGHIDSEPVALWRKETRDNRLQKIQEHLELLAVHRCGFVRFKQKEEGKNIDECCVPYSALTQTLMTILIEDSVTSRFGMLPARVIRTLSPEGVGMLDEEQLFEDNMVTQKEIRPAVLELHQAGYLKMQEIPRDTTRQTARLAWTYKFDLTQTRQRLLADTYKGMTRMFQRLDVERTKRQTVIEKAERTDVVGREDSLLPARDKEILKDWLRVEDILLRQVMRMDEVVACMRDFSQMEPFP